MKHNLKLYCSKLYKMAGAWLFSCGTLGMWWILPIGEL